MQKEIPQFSFYVMAAYAIMRSQGIELGKIDYVAHMFAYSFWRREVSESYRSEYTNKVMGS